MTSPPKQAKFAPNPKGGAPIIDGSALRGALERLQMKRKNELEMLGWCVLNPSHALKAFLRDFGVNATAHSDYVRKHLHQKGQKGQEHITD